MTDYAVLVVVELFGIAYDQRRRKSVLIIKQADSQDVIQDWIEHHAHVVVKGERLTPAQACVLTTEILDRWEREDQDEDD